MLALAVLVVSLQCSLAQSNRLVRPFHKGLSHPWLFLPPPTPLPDRDFIVQKKRLITASHFTSGRMSKILWRAGSVTSRLPPVGGDALKSSVIPSPFHLVKNTKISNPCVTVFTFELTSAPPLKLQSTVGILQCRGQCWIAPIEDPSKIEVVRNDFKEENYSPLPPADVSMYWSPYPEV